MVEGNVTVGNINGQSVDWFKDISSFNVINFKVISIRYNQEMVLLELSTYLLTLSLYYYFQKDVVVDDLEVRNFNDIDFHTFERNIVYKRSKRAVINSHKVFQNGFKVQKMLNSVRLNDIHVDNILMKSGNQNITGPISIKGKVRVQNNCEIQKNLNSYSVNVLANMFHVDGDTYTINRKYIRCSL